jgi:membrane associated rhomboid family serine protease
MSWYTGCDYIFIPALGGTILSAIFLSEYITVGASGGIFGLIGAYLADICMNWSLLFSKHVNASNEGVNDLIIRIPVVVLLLLLLLLPLLLLLKMLNILSCCLLLSPPPPLLSCE